jgi:4-cresol dehydrogenase (hydroxylating)
MGFWLLPQPEAYFSGTVMAPKRDDIHALVEGFAHLLNSKVVDGTTGVLNATSFGPPDPDLARVRVGASTGDLERYLAQKGRGYWTLDLPFYGPAKVITAQWEYAKGTFSKIPGASFRDGATYRFPLTREEIEKIPNPVPLGIPSLTTFTVGGPFSQGHMWFSPIIPMTGAAVLEATDVFEQVQKDLGYPAGALPGLPIWSFFARAFVIIYFFPIEHDIEKNRRNREVFRRLIKVAAEHGWGEYRTHTAFMDDIADTYSYNNHALRRLHETLKDALDPAGVLAPGKNGVWPKRLRKDRG